MKTGEGYTAGDHRMRIKEMSQENLDKITVELAWEGGPLRQYCSEQVSNSFKPLSLATSARGFGGQYVCSACQQPTIGVYGPRQGWVCSECMNAAKPKKAKA